MRAGLLAAALLLPACARVSVTGADGGPAAVRVHPPRAYLAVSRLPAPGFDGATHETRVLLLPDLARPRWVRVRPGLGSVSFEIALERGMLASFEATTDGRGPETGEAAAEAAGRAVDGVTRRAAARARAALPAGEAPVERLLEIRPRDDGDLDLLPVPPDEARHLLGTARERPPLEGPR